jgi:DEAD/DEAH box helicase domain-containing protein
MSDQGDIGVSVDRETIFLYDNYPGGIGFSEPLFSMHDELLARTRELIDECPCESGCPSCVGPEGNTGPHAKMVASAILDRVQAAEITSERMSAAD